MSSCEADELVALADCAIELLHVIAVISFIGREAAGSRCDRGVHSGGGAITARQSSFFRAPWAPGGGLRTGSQSYS